MDDADMAFDESDGEYDFEFNEDSNSEPDADLENQYYNSKVLRADPIKAFESFKKVLELEEKSQVKGEWGFRALKQIIKLLFAMGEYDEMIKCYKQLLTYIKSAVTSNHTEKSITSILDYISTTKSPELLHSFYETTLKALKDNQNDRLWFKTSLKQARLHLDRQEFVKLAQSLKQLRLAGTESGRDDSKNGTQILEILALEIQMYTCQKNIKKLQELYNQSLHIKSAIPHPYIMGIIRECGGKMHLTDGKFDEAITDFFEAFKNYDDAGSPRRMTSLKYLVLTNMLNKSRINPFDCPETKPYKGNPEVQAMTSLVAAYQAGDLAQFENIFRQNRAFLMDDPFIREHIEVLITNCRVQVILKTIQPYSRISLQSIANELNIAADEVEKLLVNCILDGSIKGKIDQMNKMLILKKNGNQEPRYSAIDSWVTELDSLSSCIANRLI